MVVITLVSWFWLVSPKCFPFVSMGSIRLAMAASRLIPQYTDRVKYREKLLITWNPNKMYMNRKVLH